MLKFITGTMSSGKSTQLLIDRHQLTSQGKEVLVFKPDVDQSPVKSRLDLECNVDFYLSSKGNEPEDYNWLSVYLKNFELVQIDEAQFLHPNWVDLFKQLSNDGHEIYCYGLLTDFQTKLFKGSARLLELADEVVFLKSRCKKCVRNAQVNMRVDNEGKRINSGATVDIGGDSKYYAVCWDCYQNTTSKLIKCNWCKGKGKLSYNEVMNTEGDAGYISCHICKGAGFV